MSKHQLALLCLICIIISGPVTGQTAPPPDSSVHLPKGLENRIDQKISGLDNRLSKQSDKYLHKISHQEEQILRQLGKIDSTAAADFLKTSKAAYENIQNKLAAAGTKADRLMEGEYLPFLDSLQGSLGFLKDAKNLVSKSKDIQDNWVLVCEVFRNYSTNLMRLKIYRRF